MSINLRKWLQAYSSYPELGVILYCTYSIYLLTVVVLDFSNFNMAVVVSMFILHPICHTGCKIYMRISKPAEWISQVLQGLEISVFISHVTLQMQRGLKMNRETLSWQVLGHSMHCHFTPRSHSVILGKNNLWKRLLPMICYVQQADPTTFIHCVYDSDSNCSAYFSVTVVWTLL